MCQHSRSPLTCYATFSQEVYPLWGSTLLPMQTQNRRGTKGEEEEPFILDGGWQDFPLLPFSCDSKRSATLPLLWLVLWRPCLHLSFPGPPRELGKAKSAGSVPPVLPLRGPAPLPEPPLLCTAERLAPLDVRCKLEALEEKELTSPRSPEEPPVCEGEASVSHS